MKSEQTYKDFKPGITLVEAVEKAIKDNMTLDEIYAAHVANFIKRPPEQGIKTALKMIAFFHLYSAKLHAQIEEKE